MAEKAPKLTTLVQTPDEVFVEIFAGQAVRYKKKKKREREREREKTRRRISRISLGLENGGDRRHQKNPKWLDEKDFSI